jgi:superfamily II DNA helicase RecQ
MSTREASRAYTYAQRIAAGDWQIVLISPEMLLSNRFVREVLQNKVFHKHVLSVVVDEAHVVSHWGSGFRKKYGMLGSIRAHLPNGTPIVAVSATLPARVRKDVLLKLQFDVNNFTNIDIGNDRPNVSIVVRGIHHPLNTYADLDFVVAPLVDDPSQIPKTFIYADNVATGVEIIDHLLELLPEKFRTAGLIRPYSAAFSKSYRSEVMSQFRGGGVRVLVCTDAAGMVCTRPTYR